jgi:hypothetical protein
MAEAKEARDIMANVSLLEGVLVALPEELQSCVDAAEEECEANRVRLARATFGLKHGMGLIKASGTAEQKSTLAAALKQVKTDAKPYKSERCAQLVQKVESTRKLLQECKLVTTEALVADKAGAAYDDAVRELVEAGNTLLAVADEVVRWWQVVESGQVEVAEGSLKAIDGRCRAEGEARRRA